MRYIIGIVRFRTKEVDMDSYAKAKLAQYNKSFKAIDETYRNAAKQFGMSECTFWIIYTLRTEEAPLTQSEICSFQYQPKQTVNSALKKLESDGIISFSAGSDRRNKYVALTEKGLTLAKKTVDVFAETEVEALLDMPENEQNALCNLLEKYNSLLRTKLQTANMKGDQTL